MKFLNIKRNEKGSITLFILLAILFFIIILFSIYYNYSTKNASQQNEIEKIKKNYETPSSIDEIKEIYDEEVENLKGRINVKLDDDSATESGTSVIYQYTNEGIYLDTDKTKKMTTSQNNIVIPKKNYTITYNYNGSGQEDSVIKVSFNFKGYYTQKNGQGLQMISENGYITSNFTDDYFKNYSGNTLYAKWEITNPVVLPSVTRTDYIFLGWFDSQNDGNKIGDANSIYTPTQDITLYAQWKKMVRVNCDISINRGIYQESYLKYNEFMRAQKEWTFLFDKSKAWTYLTYENSYNKFPDVGTTMLVSYSSTASLFSNYKIDVTNMDKLVLDCYLYNNATSPEFKNITKFGLASNNTTIDANWIKYETRERSSTSGSATHEIYVIDVSDLSGEYYIQISTQHITPIEGNTAYVWINNLYGEYQKTSVN